MAGKKVSITGKVALTSIILQTIVVTVLECLVIYYHVNYVSQFVLESKGQGISEADLIYHAIFILSLGFQIILAFDSILKSNTIEIISLVIFNLLSLAYAGVQLYQHTILEEEGLKGVPFKPKDINKFTNETVTYDYFRSRMRPLEYVIIGMVAGFSVFLGLIAFKLSREFGWENYKTYSADLKIRKAYVSLTILQTLIKMDIFFIGAYAIQLIPSQKIGYSSTIIETVLIFVCGTLLLLMAWFSVSHELKYLLLVVINCLAFTLIYLIWKFVRINQKMEPDPYKFTRKFLSFFLAITFVLEVITIVYASICFRNMAHDIYVFTVFGATSDGTSSINDGSRRQSALLRIFESKKDLSNRQSIIDSHRRDRMESRLSID